MTAALRVGAVNYLNTKPLIYRIEEHAPDVELVLDLPSRLAGRLAEGELDVALVPVIEYFRAENYSIIPGISIASRGPVLSVTLFSKKPWEQIESVALDVGSRTSVALTQILLQKRNNARPQLQPLPLNRDPEDLRTDAVLLIGDRAMRACLPGFEHAYDLGHEWQAWTGLPFVYAVWAVRKGVDVTRLIDVLQTTKQRGRRHVGRIAQDEAPSLGLDAGFCRRYLETVICFDLGSSELAGLQHYYELASEIGLAPTGREIRLSNCTEERYAPITAKSD